MAARPNFENRTLFHGDNLQFLQGMNSETIHLIATDPPFNKGKDFHATPESLAAGASFKDRWSWEKDVHEAWTDQIQDDWPKVWWCIEYAREAHSNPMGAFLCFLAVRAIEMHRILCEEGSLFLHCDPTASHYIKTLLDAIFGQENFRNELVWERAGGSAKLQTHTPRKFKQDTDSILFYSKSKDTRYPGIYAPYKKDDIPKIFPKVDDDGRRYHTNSPVFNSPSMGKRPNQCYTYKGVTNPYPSGWRFIRPTLQKMDADGEIVWRQDGKTPLRKSYADKSKGDFMGSLWTDISNQTSSDERTGYPTQKPIELYRRIIKAASNPGDWVLDPFCGCATTPVAAELEGRKWVGIDFWDQALGVLTYRLHKKGVKLADAKANLERFLNELRSKPGISQNERKLTERLQGEINQQSLGLKGTEKKRIVFTSQPPVKSSNGKKQPARFVTPERTASRPRHTNAQMKDILIQEYGLRCQGCYRTFDHPGYLDLDHINPRSQGGSNDIENRALLCGPCNRAKSNTKTLAGLRKDNRKAGLLHPDAPKAKEWMAGRIAK